MVSLPSEPVAEPGLPKHKEAKVSQLLCRALTRWSLRSLQGLVKRKASCMTFRFSPPPDIHCLLSKLTPHESIVAKTIQDWFLPKVCQKGLLLRLLVRISCKTCSITCVHTVYNLMHYILYRIIKHKRIIFVARWTCFLLFFPICFEPIDLYFHGCWWMESHFCSTDVAKVSLFSGCFDPNRSRGKL